MKNWMKIIIVGVVILLMAQALAIDASYRIGQYLDDQVVIVHRGGTTERPEQTLVAYEYANDQGIKVMECDARITSDKVFVAMHDDTWDRTTNGSGAIVSTKWNGYGEWLDAGSWFSPEYKGEGVPTMAELMGWAHNESILLWIDCYFSGAFDDEFLELLEDQDMTDRVVLQFMVETKDYLRAERYEDVRISYRVVLPVQDMVDSALGWCKEDGVSFMTIPWEMGTGGVYDDATEKGVRISLYSYNQARTNADYIQEFEEGAWGCFTDSVTQATLIQTILDSD